MSDMKESTNMEEDDLKKIFSAVEEKATAGFCNNRHQ
jgi:hypothetical protein